MAQKLRYPTSQNFVQKTLGAQLLAGATASATLNNLTGIQNKPGVFIVDRVDTNGVETPNKREVVQYDATSGLTVTTLTRNADTSGTDQDHAVGAIVEFGPDILWAQSVIDGLTQVVSPSTGLLDTTKVTDLTTAQTLTNKTITDSTNNVTAKSLKSATTTVDVSAATAPSAGQVLTATDSTHATWQSGGGDGWVSYATVTPTSGTLDTPTFELTFAGVDLTATLQAGMRIKLTQSTVKYFIITKVAFSTNTTVTIYGGTDYTLISTGTTAVSALSYSSAKVPFGFPTDPTKWTVRVTDTTERSQASAVASTWYNLGTTAAQISIPIGIWNTSYQVAAHVSTNAQIYVTLSTANNSASDSELVSSTIVPAAAFGGSQLVRIKTLTATTKTTYYLNTMTSSGSTPTIYNRNDTTNGSPLIIEARCAYL